MKKKQDKKQDKDFAIGSVFTINWLVQTIAAWGFSMWLTKLWKKYVKKEKKDATDNK